jgi:hypothetical protein
MSNGDERTKARPTLETERLLLRRPESMINRRFMIVPPALSGRGHVELLGKQAKISHARSLKWRT